MTTTLTKVRANGDYLFTVIFYASNLAGGQRHFGVAIIVTVVASYGVARSRWSSCCNYFGQFIGISYLLPTFNIASLSFCTRIYNCGLNNFIVVIYHVWLAAVLIIVADRHTTIGALYSLSGLYRVSAALSAVIRGITAGRWLDSWGCGYRVSITFERTIYCVIKTFAKCTLIFNIR